MIGLGVGIDYALFIVTRHKLQLREGMELRESIARATATAGGAVVFAGFTVVIALCSLAFAGIPLVSTLGFTAAIAVVVAVCAATTLLPAMLGALGPRINSLRVQFGKTHPDDARAARLAALGAAGRRPPLALDDRRPRRADRPRRCRSSSSSSARTTSAPCPRSTTARQAYDALTEGFGPGRQRAAAGRLRIREREEAKRCCRRCRSCRRRRRRRRGLANRPSTKPGTVAVFTVISKSAPWADETVDLVEGLRDDDDPRGAGGDRRRRLRRRPDRRLHRPRRPRSATSCR